MTRITKSMIAAMVFSLVSTVGVQVNANDYDHLDQLALDIQNKAQLLETEVRHYRHTPEYKHLRSDARELRRLASHIHTMTHVNGGLRHIESDRSCPRYEIGVG